jgi:hypothetical protein
VKKVAWNSNKPPSFPKANLNIYNNRVVVFLKEQDQVIYQRRLANPLPTILEPIAPYQAEIIGVVVESTYNWYWLVAGLMEAG